jgi:hypothetical protein
MKKIFLLIFPFIALSLTACHCRHLRTAIDATPGNPRECQLDCHYGANDIRIQTTKLSKTLMDKWYSKTKYRVDTQDKPTIVFGGIENRTDMYIPTDLIQDVLEGVAINDGRFRVVVSHAKDESELDFLMHKQQCSQKYLNSTRLDAQSAYAPRFLAKLRITKAKTKTPCYDIEDYRMTMTLYDIESQECVDQAFDLLRKFVTS